MNDPSSPADPAPERGRRRRRIPRLLLVLVVALVLLGVAPLVAAPLLRDAVVDELATRTDARAHIGSLALSWGDVRVSGLELEDREGRRLVAVEDVDVSFDLLALLGGRTVADVRVRGVDVHLRREQDGRLNLERLARQLAGEASRERDRERTGDEPDAVPSVRARLDASGVAVVAHDPDDASRTTRLDELSLALTLEDLARPAPFSASLSIEGPDGPGGSLSLDGEVTLAHGERLGAGTVRGYAGYALEAIDGAALQPLLAVLGGVREVRGTLEGDGRFALVGPLALEGRGELALTGGAFTLEGERVRVPDVSLSTEAALDEDLSGTQTLTLDVGPALLLDYEGSTTTPTGASGGVSGSWAGRGRLGPLLALLAPWVPLRAGLEVGGELALDGTLDLGLGEGRLRGGTLAAEARVTEASAREADGTPIELGELRELELALDLSGDREQGTLAVRDLVLAAGPVTAGGTLGLGGLGPGGDLSGLRLDDSDLELQADLDRLGLLVTPLLELPGLRLGGRVDLAARARSASAPVELTVDLDVADLLVSWPVEDGTPLLFGPLVLTLDERARLDVAADTLEVETLTVGAPFLDVSASGSLAGVLAARPTGTLEAALSLRPEAASAALGDLLGGWTLRGEPLDGDTTLTLGEDALDVTASWTSPRLGVGGGALARPIEVRALRAELEAAWAGEAGTLELPSLALDSSLFALTGSARLENLATPDAGVATTAALQASGGIEPLREILASLVPELADARGAGTWRFDLDARHEGTSNTLEPTLALRDANLTGFLLGGEELPLRDVALELRGTLTLDTTDGGRARLQQTRLTAPGLTLTADGRGSGLLADASERAAHATLGLDLDPAELSERMAAVLAGVRLSGEPLSGRWQVDVEGRRADVDGTLGGEALTIVLPPAAAGDEAPVARTPRAIVQREPSLRVDARVDLTPGRDGVTLRDLRYASRTTSLAASGTLGRVLDPEAMEADVEVRVDAGLARLVEDLGPLLALGGVSLEGDLEQTLTVRGEAGRLRVEGRGGIDDLVARLPPRTRDATPHVVEEPRLDLTLAADVATGPMDVVIETLAIDGRAVQGTLSGTLRGLGAVGGADGASAGARVEGMVGSFEYVPDRLGAILQPWLPVPWHGAQTQTLELSYDGALADLDPLALLREARAEANAGLGTITIAGVDVSGPARVDVADGRVRADASLSLLGGSLSVQAALDLRPQGSPDDPVRSTLSLELDAISAGGRVGALLATLHPLFTGAAEGGGSASALLDGGLQLVLDGPLPRDLLDALDPSRLPLASLRGQGRLDVGELTLSSSPLLSQMLSTYGLAAGGDGGPYRFAVAPVDFRIEGGALRYEQPWPWTIRGIETTFTGAVGLDERVEMAWNIPVNEALVDEYDELEPLLGESVSIPIRGTVRAPRLDLDGVLGDLVARAAEARLKGAVEEEIGGTLGEGGLTLEGVLGGVLAKEAEEALEDDDEDEGEPPDPARLLKRADRLWDEGETERAIELYKRLRRDFKDSDVFEEHRERIRDRIRSGREDGEDGDDG